MKNMFLAASGALILTAAVWGLSYSAQSEAMKNMQPLFFVSLRYFLGAAVLLPFIFLRKKTVGKIPAAGGIICGVFLAGGEILQQIGLLYTSAGKTGFLTALYVIMIPVIEIFFGKKSNWKIWTASLLSVAGAYLLCSDGTFAALGNTGDLLVILCALFFAFQFIAIARFAPDADALQLAAIQFFTVAVLSGAAAILSGEECSREGIAAAAFPLLYCGIIAIGFACTVQVAAQKYVHPATASIILSTASVFAVIWGALLLNESYSLLNLLGCGLIFSAVLLVRESSPEKTETHASVKND